MFARRIIRLYAALSKDTAAQILGKQVLRTGTSVGANYREANRARSKAEFIAKYTVAADVRRRNVANARCVRLLTSSATPVVNFPR